MARPPPRKRQRRQVVSSEDEDEQEDENGSLSSNAPELTSPTRKHVSVSKYSSHNGHGVAGRPHPSSFLSTQSATTEPRTQMQAQTQTTLPGLLSPKASRTKTYSTKSSSPATSPEKRKTRKTVDHQHTHDKHAKSPTKGTDNTKSLRNFFGPATDEQRWDRAERALPNTKAEAAEAKHVQHFGWEEHEDQIEDDGVDEIFESFLKSQQGEDKNIMAEKSGREVLGDTFGNGRAHRVTERRKFKIPLSPDNGATTPSPSSGGSGLPWPEEFAPANLDELAVHKKKVADVQNWLTGVFSGRSKQRVLVLRGPAGSGKTTTVSLLSKALGYDVVEWKNSTGDPTARGAMSMGAHFDDFLGRSDKFSTLDMDNEQPAQKRPENSDMQQRIILVEEFPTSLSPGSSGLISFRTALQSYLAAAVPRLGIGKKLTAMGLQSSPPIVIIVSETLLGTSSSMADNFTVHRLLGPEISNHPGVNIIEFNRVAPTFISKALDLVLKKEARRSGRRRVPGPAVLKQMGEMGDVRSAISSLEFLCLRGDSGGGSEGWSGTLASRIKKPGKTGIPPTAMEKESLEMVTQRESSLGIFHAVGKVVYNKREDPAMSCAPEASSPILPPPHLQCHARPKVSQVSIDDLINEIGTDIQTFIAALHENYVLSCSGSSFLDYFEPCISWLSDTDILGPESRRYYRTSRRGVGSARSSSQGYGSSMDVIRQEEISFQVAVRSLLFSLPHPVKRRAPQGTRTGDAHKMFFPTSLRLSRENEEIEGLLDLWTHRLTSSSPGGQSNTKTQPGGVESWKNRFSAGISPNKDVGSEEEPTEVRSLLSRDEVLLERLPYLGLISKRPSDVKQFERLIKFQGIVDQSDDLADEDLEDLDAFQPVLTHGAAGPTANFPGVRRHTDQSRTQDMTTESVENEVDKLLLSDDDIEE